MVYKRLYFMTDGDKLDIIYASLLEQSRNPKYAFGSLRGNWGYTNSPSYNDNKSRFDQSMEMFARDCGLRYYNGNYYFYNGKIYDIVSTEVVEMAYETLLRDLCLAPMMHKPIVRREGFMRTIAFRNSFVPRLDLIGFENGVLDLSNPKSTSFISFSPILPITYYRPYRYDENAKCDRWQFFLREVLPDKTSRTILQMFLGLGLTQRNVAFSESWRHNAGKVELCLLLIGGGANGKSVIFDVMRALFGDAKISKLDYSTLTAGGDEGLRGRLPIRGMTFNWSSDSNPRKFGGSKSEQNLFKQIVSGEPVPVRGIGRNIEMCDEVPYLIFNMNALPNIDDDSNGMVRRLQIIPFDITVPLSKRDPNLSAKIIQNELPGIFNWVMRGTKELFRRKFRFPDAEGSRMAMLKTLITRSPIIAWVKTYNIRCDKEAPNEVPVHILGNDLYAAFVRFCKDNDVDETLIPTSNRFGRDMRDKLNFFKKRTGSGVYYEVYGITLDRLKQPVFVTDIQEIEGEADDDNESFIKDND